MSETTSSIRHFRTPPDHWADLQQYATTDPVLANYDNDALAPNDGFRTILHYNATLTNNSLDAARYYALGLGMCELTKILQDKQRQHQIAQDCGKSLFTIWASRSDTNSLVDNRQLEAANLSTFELRFASNPIQSLANEAMLQLPPATRLTCDALTIVEGYRKTSIISPGLAGHSIESWLYENIQPSDLVEGRHTAGVIAPSLFMAAGAIGRIIANRLHELHLPDNQSPPPLTSRVLEEPYTTRIGRRMARMRLDEFQQFINRITADEAHHPTLPKEGLPRTINDLNQLLPESSRPTLFHNERLMCPAHLVEGLIPLVFNLLRAGIDYANIQISHYTPESND